MTSTLRHHSPLGPITIRGIAGLVPADTDFDVPDHIAARLLEQDDVYELVSGDPRERDEQTVRQLRHELADRGLPYDGHKEDLVARAIESDKVAPPPLVQIDGAVPPAPVELPADPNSSGRQLPEFVEGDTTLHTTEATDESADEDAPEPAGGPADVVTDEPTTTEPATGQEGA